jgi:hypothetical protein
MGKRRYHSLSFISAVDEKNGHNHVRPLYPAEKSHVSHWTGDWVGLRTSLNAMVNIKIAIRLGIEPRFPVV